MQRDKENVDRAQVQRQIVPVEIPADLQTDLLERLVRKQENGEELSQLRPLLLVRRLVALAAQRGKGNIQRKRHQMPRAEERKAKALADRIHRIPKALHLIKPPAIFFFANSISYGG